MVTILNKISWYAASFLTVPVSLLEVFWNIIHDLFTGNPPKKEGELSIEFSGEAKIWLTLIFWVVIGYLAYNRYAYNYIHYAFACPDTSSSKCYKVQINISNHSDTFDERTYYYTLVDQIVFPNGGYQEFEDCEVDKHKPQFSCTDTDGNSWNIELSKEVTKIKK